MAGQLTIDTLKASSGVLATQNGMTGIAKAWVNYNAATSSIRSSFNVGSVTKITTGQFRVNFTTAMPDANYSFNISFSRALADNGGQTAALDSGVLNTSLTFATLNYNSSTFLDNTNTCVSVFSA